MTDPLENPTQIGTLQETSLHAALKKRLARPGDQFEVELDGYFIDIIHGDLLIEIQTGNFTALKRKLGRLLPNHPVCVVYPIAQERWVRRITAENQQISRRKSPKRGRIEELFLELVRLPDLVIHPNFSLKALLIQEEVIWRDDGRGSWRRKGWSIADRLLLDVHEFRDFNKTADYLALLPNPLNYPFTNNDLVRSSRMADDYTFEITFEGKRDGQEIIEITCIPKPDAAVVWGKIGVEVRPDKIPVRMRYYDEDLELARTMTFAEVETIGGRTLPTRSRIQPADKPDEYTEIMYAGIDFDIEIPDSVFSLRNLQR